MGKPEYNWSELASYVKDFVAADVEQVMRDKDWYVDNVNADYVYTKEQATVDAIKNVVDGIDMIFKADLAKCPPRSPRADSFRYNNQI